MKKIGLLILTVVVSACGYREIALRRIEAEERVQLEMNRAFIVAIGGDTLHGSGNERYCSPEGCITLDVDTPGYDGVAKKKGRTHE